MSGWSSLGKVSLKMMRQAIWETEYYNTLYYTVVPSYRRAPSFSSMSRILGQSQSESRGVIEPLQRDPSGGDPGTGVSVRVTRPTTLGQNFAPRPSGHTDMGY